MVLEVEVKEVVEEDMINRVEHMIVVVVEKKEPADKNPKEDVVEKIIDEVNSSVVKAVEEKVVVSAISSCLQIKEESSH